MKISAFSILIFSFILTASASASARISLKNQDQQEVLSVLKANESLQEHFFHYKASLLEEDAKRLKQAILKIHNKKIKAILAASVSALDKIKAKNDRKANNLAYHQANLGLIELLKEYDVGHRYNAYSCPMVKKKWVQNSEKKLRVHNPYAPQMPHCGQRDTDYNEK